MPHPCVVCGRSRMNPNNREQEYVFFGFPVADEVRCKKWLEFCCREDLYKLTKKQLLQRMVCSKHFEQKDFLNDYLDRLNCNAIPSIYDPTQSLYSITCVLCGRSRRNPPGIDYDGATFHHFPGEEFRCLEWLDFVGVDSYYRLTRKEILFCYICSKHFDRSQFMQGYKSRLIDNAVPNIHNPDRTDIPEPFVAELVQGPKLFSFPEMVKKLDPLPPVVLESQACAACGRSRSDPRNKVERYKFHPFPAYEIGRCLRWCQFLGREDLLKMSPNQIRKLVLCSKHFQTGQSFNKVGPCDAVPTIKDINDETVDKTAEQLEYERVIEDCVNAAKGIKKEPSPRPSVSSKKPKVDNKPAPLAKKRGRSRRPTSINIPRPDPNNLDNRIVRKLPLPSTSNWNIQFADQYQPLMITNNITPTAADTIAGSIKKLILPFTGDISNLGAPIPVNSLSSIPPGLLIKINLPEQEQQKVACSAKRQKTRNVQCTVAPNDVYNQQQTRTMNGQVIASVPVIGGVKRTADKQLVQLLTVSSEEEDRKLMPTELDVSEVVVPDVLETIQDEGITEVKEEQYYMEYEEITNLPTAQPRIPRRKKMSRTARRTIFPIKNEVKYFFRKLTPLMHRLPKKTRAQIKLAIVNMVIDTL